MATVEAKSKVRLRHSIAIANFKEWHEKNPDVSFKRLVRKFDKCVDTALREPK